VVSKGGRPRKKKSWTDGIVWDPREEAFDAAYRKILDRALEIALVEGRELVRYMPNKQSYS